MNPPTSVVITGCDSPGGARSGGEGSRRLRCACCLGGRVEALLARTAPFASAGEFELFKTSEKYDGTARNPHWLEEARL